MRRFSRPNCRNPGGRATQLGETEVPTARTALGGRLTRSDSSPDERWIGNAPVLSILGQVCARFNWRCHAWCQMTNHFHLVLETPDANLSPGMRQLNGVYTQQFNRRHALAGHLFQGRIKAILIERDTYLLELARYVVLNPVRAGTVARPDGWPWSSYRAMVGAASTPEWLETDWILSQFGEERARAQAGYAASVAEGIGQPSLWDGLRHQVLLGSESFVEHLFRGAPPVDRLREVPRVQRRVLAKPLAEFATTYLLRREAMARVFLTGAYTMREIAEHFRVHYSTVSQLAQ